MTRRLLARTPGPSPTISGYRNRRYSSTRSASVSSWATLKLPVTPSQPGASRSARTSPTSRRDRGRLPSRVLERRRQHVLLDPVQAGDDPGRVVGPVAPVAVTRSRWRRSSCRRRVDATPSIAGWPVMSTPRTPSKRLRPRTIAAPTRPDPLTRISTWRGADRMEAPSLSRSRVSPPATRPARSGWDLDRLSTAPINSARPSPTSSPSSPWKRSEFASMARRLRQRQRDPRLAGNPQALF